MFPSQIAFWIRLNGLPLHYWHEKMIYNIGHDLGTVEDYKISKTSARMKVSLDGLKPITKEALIEFDTGEELPVTLEYEGLDLHCLLCNELSHLAKDCPLSPPDDRISTARRTRDMDDYGRLHSQSYQHHSSGDKAHKEKYQVRPSAHSKSLPFNERLYRHGIPFSA